MPLRLFYITNEPEVACVAQEAGVDAIFVDLEIQGKEARQGHLDTVISHHTLADVAALRAVLDQSALLVRINPVSPSTKDEIDAVIDAGADIVMLPMFTTVQEVEHFLSDISGRVETCLLVETPGAVENLDDILLLPGIDSIHIGLNDLHLAYGMRFMFELLADGTVEHLASKISTRGIRYGFGGVAHLGTGILPAEYIITEHYRLRSSQVILGRSFCDRYSDSFACSFTQGVVELRAFEAEVAKYSTQRLSENKDEVIRRVSEVAELALV